MIPDNPRVGVIGFGEVGYHIAKGLKQAGVSQIIAYDNASITKPALTEVFQQKAESIGIKLATTPEELARGADLILSTVIPKASIAAVTEAAPFLTPAQLYVDLNSCSPEAKKEGEAVLKERGVRYVDGAIMGAPLQLEHQAQIFACGDGAEEFHDIMSRYGMKIRVISSNIGDAALLKMIYSVTTKGISALLWESFLALHKAGLEPNVYEGLNNWLTQMGLFDRADMIIGRSAIHAARRAGEMEFSADTLRTLGVEPMVAEATQKRLSWCADFNFKDYFPEGWPTGFKAVFEVMDRITQENKPQT